MIGHAVSRPLDQKLSAYIDSYIHFRHTTGTDQLYKNVLPCLNVAVIFNEAPLRINGQAAPDIMVIGLHENLHRVEAASDQVNSFVIRFTPFGFSRFVSTPVSDLTGKIAGAQTVFGKGIHLLFHELKKQKNIESRIRLLEQYLLSRLKEPGEIDHTVSRIADYLQQDPQSFSFETIRKKIPFDLSDRQLLRRFKNTIGVNLQTYARISRFEAAKKLFFGQRDESLTQIGLLSGYYDQAHFAREFKKLSGIQARKFFPACSLQRILHEGTPLQQAV